MPDLAVALPSNLIAQALTRQLKPDQLLPGQYSLAGFATVELACTVSKGTPVEQRKPLKLEWPAIVAALLRRLKVPIDKTFELIEDAVTAPPIEGVDFHLAAIDAHLKDLKEEQPRGLIEGATKVAGRVEIVRWQSP